MSADNIDADGYIETVMKLSQDSVNKIQAEAKERNVEESVIVEEWMQSQQGGFFVGEFDIEESVVTLKYIDPWSELDTTVTQSGAADKRVNNRKVYRRLRDHFPPTKSGVEYAKSFTSGGGFTIDIDDINNKIQQKNRKIITALNRNIFQDEIIRGMSTLLDIMMDETFTVGASGAEIVYENEIDTDKLMLGEIEPTTYPLDTPNIPEFETRDPNTKEWKKLGGVVQLKIIDDAQARLTPYRNPLTYRIEYWTIDEDRTEKLNIARKDKKLAPVQPRKLFPWQVLWLPWSIRGTDITGHSIIEGVAEIALLLENILKAVGISFQKWSDKKYFFVLGSPDGRTWAPPKVRQFLHDVKKMTTSNGTGIAVPAGFDIKEIGGEIFEGGQVIDYLLTLICNGMNYPKTFLDQGSATEGDQAWMAWIRTYSNYQNLLTTNIEHQLWARHLYCKVGTTQEVAKQGVRIDTRSKIPTYVPIMSWRSDGKWQTHTKIEQQTKVLNVANPIDPTLKLQLEKDIAITLGFTEIDWKTAEKLLQEQQQLLLLDQKIEAIKAEMLVEALVQAKEDGVHLDMIPRLRDLSAPKPEGEDVGAVQDVGQDKAKDTLIDEKDKDPNEKRPKPVPGKRLEGGVSRTPKGEPSEKGKSKPLGGSRQAKPRKVQETEIEDEVTDIVEETEAVPQAPESPQKVELEITVKQESTPQEILVKTEPLQITSEPQKVEVEIKSEPQKVEVEVTTEPQKIEVETTSKNDPIVFKLDESNVLNAANQDILIERVQKILEEKYNAIKDIETRNKAMLKEMQHLEETLRTPKTEEKKEPTESEIIETELNKKKLELMKKLLENKDTEEKGE